MNGPFFRNYSKQQPSRSGRSVPVQQTQQVSRSSSPKVVSVPVHFISSEQPQKPLPMSKDSAVLKIQKVLRGYLVRKNLKKIASIKSEVSEIERRIGDIEVADLIGRDAKERLRVNETLMSLLFKLDSIRSVDCGVRDLRKAVTRKAIALQEKVDSIAQPDHQTLDSPNNDSGQIDVCNSSSETSGFVDEVLNNMEAVEDDDGVAKDGGKEDDDTCCGVEGSMEVQKKFKEKEYDDDGDDDKGNREVLEKLRADNEKMMKVMMQISERNEMQTRMINSLSRRVEQLEKAFLSDNLRRRKKRENKKHMLL